jgi:hypothetical protein
MSLLTAPLEVLSDAARVPLFWVLFGTFFICGLSTNGLIQTHFITLCGDYGLTAVSAASVLAMMGVFDFIGTIGSGWLADRYDNRWLLFWYYGLRGLSLLYLPFTSFTFYGLSLFAVFYGLDWIATVPPTVKLTADRFGRERAGVWLGFCGPSDRRRDGGLRRRVFAHGICELPAGLLRRRDAVPRCGDAGPDHRQAVVGGRRRRHAGAGPRLEHDPEKWKPIFRQDHAQLRKAVISASPRSCPRSAPRCRGRRDSSPRGCRSAKSR